MRKFKIPNELRRFFNSMFLTIAILFVLFIALNLEGIDGKYDKLFSAVGSVGSLFIGYGAYQISKRQEESLNYKTSSDQREVLRQNYKKLKQAIRSSLIEPTITFETAKLIWEVEEEAKLELSEEIQKYTSKIRQIIIDDFAEQIFRETENKGGLPQGDERTRKFQEHLDRKNLLGKEEPEKIYSKYLKMPNKITS